MPDQQDFARAEEWFTNHKADLSKTCRGWYICINDKTLAYSFGKSSDKAMQQHYGPPSPHGDHFLVAWIPASETP